jgi:S-adenosylmethionine:tRNA ribosyltransferase-isomerase
VTDSISLDLFDYELPRERIAQHPLPERDEARLLVLDRRGGPDRHSQVRELSRWLRAGDLLVGNASWVRPARLRGRKASGGAAEALILGALRDPPGHYRALLRCAGRLRECQRFSFGAPEAATIDAELAALGEGGEVTLASRRVSRPIPSERCRSPPTSGGSDPIQRTESAIRRSSRASRAPWLLPRLVST